MSAISRNIVPILLLGAAFLLTGCQHPLMNDRTRVQVGTTDNSGIENQTGMHVQKVMLLHFAKADAEQPSAAPAATAATASAEPQIAGKPTKPECLELQLGDSLVGILKAFQRGD